MCVCVCVCVCVRVFVCACMEKGRDVKSGRSVTNRMRVCVCMVVLYVEWQVKEKHRNVEKKWEIWKRNKKSCYSVWPARALRINLAGVTVPDLYWGDIEDPCFFQNGWRLDPGKDCAHLFVFFLRQSVCVSVLEKGQSLSSTRGRICVIMSNIIWFSV